MKGIQIAGRFVGHSHFCSRQSAARSSFRSHAYFVTFVLFFAAGIDAIDALCSRRGQALPRQIRPDEPGSIHGVPDDRALRWHVCWCCWASWCCWDGCGMSAVHHRASRTHHDEAEHRHRLSVSRYCALFVDAVLQQTRSTQTGVRGFRTRRYFCWDCSRCASTCSTLISESTSCCSRTWCNRPIPAGWLTLRHSASVSPG